MVVAEHLGSDGVVTEQFQLIQWADDESSKCIITSEIDVKYSAYYSDSITDALGELVAYCWEGLNVPDDSRIESS